MSSKDVLDCVRQEGPVLKGIGLEIVEGPGDGDLVGGYRVGVQGGVDKLVSDDDQLRFKVTGELDWEQGRREGHWEAMVNGLNDESV